jgi:DNA primase
MGDMFDLKERIRELNPIDEVIGATIALRRQGHTLVGAHHTHGSASGTSLHVDSGQGLYYCFNGGEGGSCIESLVLWGALPP